MQNTLPELDLPKIILVEKDGDTTGDILAVGRSRRHHLPEGQTHNAHVFAFNLSATDRVEIAAGADLYIAQVTYNGKPNELITLVGRGAAAEYFDVPVLDLAGANAKRMTALAEIASAAAELATAIGTAIDPTADASAKDNSLNVRRMHVKFKTLDAALMKLREANASAGVVMEP